MKTSATALAAVIFSFFVLAPSPASAWEIFNPRTPICSAYGCGGPPRPVGPIGFERPLQNGVWASNEGKLVVSENGSTVSLGCSSGEIPGEILLLNNSFSKYGTLHGDVGVGGPISFRPELAVRQPRLNEVLYSGVVVGNTLELTVEGHTYTLEYGSEDFPLSCE